MAKQLNIRGVPRQAFEQGAGRQFPLGTRMHTPDGRVFRMAQAASTAISAGRTCQLDRSKLHFQDLTLSYAARNDQFLINVSVPDTVNQDEFEDGLVYVYTGGGAGIVYNVEGNTQVTASSTQMTLNLDVVTTQGISTSTSRVSVFKNRFKALTIADAPPSAAVVGVTPQAITASYYFWLQTHGAAAVLQEGPLWDYKPIAASHEASGAVRLATVTVPDSHAGLRHGSEGLALTPTLQPDGDAYRAEVIAPVSGIAVVSDVPLGYVLHPRDDGNHALVYLTIDN